MRISKISKKHPVQLQVLQKDLKKIKIQNNKIIESKGNIRVFCRIRPLLTEGGSEKENIMIDSNMMKLYVPECQLKSDNTIKEHTFYFEQVFEKSTSQQNVFANLEELIQSSMDGYNVCIFAYGQTGSGKTFTMEGEEADNIGIIPRSVGFIFDNIDKKKKENWNFQLKVSYQEIYMEQQVDLLKKDRNNQIGVIEVQSAQEVYKLLKQGKINRSVAATNMNEKSSRSHSIFQLFVEANQMNQKAVLKGSLNLIDLAGSERLTDSQTQGQQLKETKFINKSLTSLGDVITAMKNNTGHIPFRNSCLTSVLSQYLEGDSKTLMMVNISPEEKSFAQTLQSLRFADKVADCKKKNQFHS